MDSWNQKCLKSIRMHFLIYWSEWYDVGERIVPAHDRDGRGRVVADGPTLEILENEEVLKAHVLEKP